jgi:hypothetical protein
MYFQLAFLTVYNKSVSTGRMKRPWTNYPAMLERERKRERERERERKRNIL